MAVCQNVKICHHCPGSQDRCTQQWAGIDPHFPWKLFLYTQNHSFQTKLKKKFYCE